ncbi:MAG: hypothetical protein FD123_34 [Bacteroidetes bacterium]|nr:MAG: hypothetical protein FD123_34 [Bacteroidota bacterium]
MSYRYGYGGLGSGEVIVLLLVVLAVVLPIAIFYLLNLQRTLEAVSPECRKHSPGSVWLLLIPIFNYIWIFILVAGIAESLENEYRKRGMHVEPRPTYSIGITYASLNIASAVFNIIPNPATKILAALIGLTGFVFWIIYWVKTAEHKNRLNQMNMGYPPNNYNPYNQQYNQQQYNPYNQQQYNPYNQQNPNYNPNQQYNQQNPNYNNPNQQYNQNPQTPPLPPPDPNDHNRWKPNTDNPNDPNNNNGGNNNNPNTGNPNDPNNIWQPPQPPPAS